MSCWSRSTGVEDTFNWTALILLILIYLSHSNGCFFIRIFIDSWVSHLVGRQGESRQSREGPMLVKRMGGTRDGPKRIPRTCPIRQGVRHSIISWRRKRPSCRNEQRPWFGLKIDSIQRPSRIQAFETGHGIFLLLEHRVSVAIQAVFL